MKKLFFNVYFDYLKKQVKVLLCLYWQGDVDVVVCFVELLFVVVNCMYDEMFVFGLCLYDVQFCIVCEYGFVLWVDFGVFVEIYVFMWELWLLLICCWFEFVYGVDVMGGFDVVWLCVVV